MRRSIYSLVLGLLFFGGCAHKNHTPAKSLSGCEIKSLSTLYFGLNTPSSTITEIEWQSFLKDQVTPSFPSGLTVLEARGQWLGDNGVIVREPSRIVEILHDGSAQQQEAINRIIKKYKSEFQQESVMLLKDQVTACFE